MVDGSTGILFELQLLDAHSEVSCDLLVMFLEKGYGAIESDWLVVLCYLVAERLVTVEVVFPVEGRDGRDVTIEGACEL